ncbi:histidine triad nucleotide-binding protein [Denitratisoma oestradiolicum]|uniref:Protein HitA n=1 Tax=Denitratisoma oestradiolicum TaxID=311182 RepID=A0A6S6XZC4_9PROT|nr:histidine triad nucleotide-binding protein [Denitratisoma oestradiolicum]TWO80062.1 histidine triad nucleotide-binding protein [Denitratisoma oestradiolicum]CAB1369767.1 Protein HitA [Denitratisoma oestradiolicum]
MADCIFCKIAAGEVPCKKIYEDEQMLAFHDINPQRPVHFLIIPKLHLATLYDVAPEHEALLGRLLIKAVSLARSEGLDDGFRTIVNTGRVGGQEVYHLHLHVLGGPEPVGPMVRKP